MSDFFDDQYQYDSSDDTRSDSDFEVVIDQLTIPMKKVI